LLIYIVFLSTSCDMPHCCDRQLQPRGVAVLLIEVAVQQTATGSKTLVNQLGKSKK